MYAIFVCVSSLCFMLSLRDAGHVIGVLHVFIVSKEHKECKQSLYVCVCVIVLFPVVVSEGCWSWVCYWYASCSYCLRNICDMC